MNYYIAFIRLAFVLNELKYFKMRNLLSNNRRKHSSCKLICIPVDLSAKYLQLSCAIVRWDAEFDRNCVSGRAGTPD